MTPDKLTLLSGYKYMKLGGKKHPDHIEDSYERLSANWMAAGSRLSNAIINFSSFPYLSQTCFSVNIFKLAVGPTLCSSSGLQSFSPERLVNNHAQFFSTFHTPTMSGIK